jgi:hypothetical protein
MTPAPSEACGTGSTIIGTGRALALLLLLHAVAFAPLWTAPLMERSSRHEGDDSDSGVARLGLGLRRQFVRWDDAELFEQATFWRGLRRPQVSSGERNSYARLPPREGVCLSWRA